MEESRRDKGWGMEGMVRREEALMAGSIPASTSLPGCVPTAEDKN